MKFQFRFEMSSSGNYVGVLADSRLVKGKIASQNAGSSDGGIYYQVGGGGVNGYFYDALAGPQPADETAPRDTTLVDAVNKSLVAAYDSRFGKGAWKQDHNGRDDRLTSFYIPLPANAHSVGTSVGSHIAGMVYSVGPRVDAKKFPDRDLYRQIYVDALSELAAANKNAGAIDKIEGFRLTLISTGIYGPPAGSSDAISLAADAADIILEAVEAAARLPDAAYLPATMLVNNSKVAKAQPNKELNAFTSAAALRSITVDSTGFTLDASAQTQAKRTHS